MGLILSIIAGLGGTVAGSAARAAVDMAERQLTTSGKRAASMTINGSIVGSVTAGVVTDAIGAGPSLAFWLGAVLGAAGIERLDRWALQRVGVDPDELISKARQMAEQQRPGKGSRSGTAVEVEA